MYIYIYTFYFKQTHFRFSSTRALPPNHSLAPRRATTKVSRPKSPSRRLDFLGSTRKKWRDMGHHEEVTQQQWINMGTTAEYRKHGYNDRYRQVKRLVNSGLSSAGIKEDGLANQLQGLITRWWVFCSRVLESRISFLMVARNFEENKAKPLQHRVQAEKNLPVAAASQVLSEGEHDLAPNPGSGYSGRMIQTSFVGLPIQLQANKPGGLELFI